MIDLHTHTKYSDGTWSLTELLANAENNKVNFLSITDHDTIDAYRELETINIKDYYQGKIIVGSELNAIYDGIKIELLGYDFDYKQMDKMSSCTDCHGIKKIKRKIGIGYGNMNISEKVIFPWIK